MSSIVLKPGRERAIRNRHPWIFRGRLPRVPHHMPTKLTSTVTTDSGRRVPCGVHIRRFGRVF